MEPFAGVTVGEVLDLISGARLLAGAGGLGRFVRSVGVLESPEAPAAFAKAGDFLITSLYAIKDDPAAQTSLVAELNQRGVAALAVKKRYVGDLPEAMLADAEGLGFPLIELPSASPYSEVMQPVFAQIVNRQAKVLERQQQAHSLLMRAVLEGRGLDSLVESLAALLDNPVIITDLGGGVLAAAGSGANASANTGANASADATLDSLLALMPQEAHRADYVLSLADTVHRRETLIQGSSRQTRIITPIVFGGHSFGQLVVWEVNRPMAELDLITVNSAVTVVALQLSYRRSLMEVERRYRNEFLEVLFSASDVETEGLAQRARLFGLDLGRPYYVVALRLSGGESETFQAAGSQQAARDQLYDLLVSHLGPGVVMGQVALHTVILLQPRDFGPGSDAKAEAIKRASGILKHLQPVNPLLRITIGIGTPQQGIKGLRHSFDQAQRAAAVGEAVWGPGRVYHYANLGLYQILGSLAPSEELEWFMEGVQRLDQYDQDHRTDLLQTLDAYLEAKGNVREVSRRLYTHYNTVLYRLQRIQQITSYDLESAADRLHLQVALHAYKLFRNGRRG